MTANKDKMIVSAAVAARVSGVATSTGVCRPHFHAPLHPWLSDSKTAWHNPFGNDGENKPPSPLVPGNHHNHPNHHNLFSFPPTPPKDSTPDSVTTNNSSTNHTSTTTTAAEYQHKNDFNKSDSAFSTKTTSSSDYSQKNMDGFNNMHKSDYLAHAAALNAVAFIQHENLDVKPGMNMLSNGILGGSGPGSKQREGMPEGGDEGRSPGHDGSSSSSESSNPRDTPPQPPCFPPPPPLQPSPYHDANYYGHYHHGNLFKPNHHHPAASPTPGLHSNLKNSSRNKSRSSAGKITFPFLFISGVVFVWFFFLLTSTSDSHNFLFALILTHLFRLVTGGFLFLLSFFS